MPNTPSSLALYEPRILPALRRIQEQFGYLKPDELRRFSKSSGIPLYRLQEVASFFPHFRLTPASRVTVRVCRDMACHMNGSAALMKELAAAAGEHVSVEGVSCLGRCDRPVAVSIAAANGPGRHEEFYCLGRNAGGLKHLIAACAEGAGETGDRDAARTYPSADWLVDPYKNGERDYRAVKKVIAARDEDLRRAAESLSRTMNVSGARAGEVLDAIRGLVDSGKDSGRGDGPDNWVKAVLAEFDKVHGNLRGMGGAGIPASQKWQDVRNAVELARRRRDADRRAFVVVNGDESEPGTFKDRELLLHCPHLVIEAVIIAGLITDATQGFIYIRHEFAEQIAACRAEIERAEQRGICGMEARVLGRPFPVSVFVSPGGYICGEQSALIEAMSDRRGEPRNLPPGLETNGLDDRPTLLSNVETYAWVPYIVLNGGDSYAKLGANGRKGRRFFSVCGDVTRPGVYEVPMGMTLRELVCGERYCQGIADGRKLKAFAPSGPSGGFLPARIPAPVLTAMDPRSRDEWERFVARQHLDPTAKQIDILDLELELDLFRAVSPTHALGAGLVVYHDGRDMVEQTVNAVEFFRNESCGKCVPCRVGSQKIANLGGNLLAGRIDAKEWNESLLPLVKDLCEVMGLSSICGLGRSVPMPIGTLIDFFADDLHRYLAHAQPSRRAAAVGV